MKTVWLRWRPVAAGFGLLALLYILYTAFGGAGVGRRATYQCDQSYETEPAITHVKTYCNFPEVDGAHGQEGEVSTTKDGTKLQLVSVHALIRHGDRDNLHSLPNYKNPPLSCAVTEELRMLLPDLVPYENRMKKLEKEGRKAPSQTFQDFHLYPKKEKCSPGLLTPEGAAQHIFNGKLFRQKYIDKHQLIDFKDLYKEVILRSTPYPRTYQSALALFYGFLPELDVAQLSIQKAENNTMCSEETGYPCHCDVISQLIDDMSATYKQTTPEVRGSLEAWPLYQHLAEVFDVQEADLPKPSHIMDMFMVHVCHNRPLPFYEDRCVQPWAVQRVYDLLAHNGHHQIVQPDFLRVVRLKFQPLLHEIAERMVKQGHGDTDVKFMLYAGHDTTIEPLAAALNFSSGLWSGYAARIVFELYSHPVRLKQMTPLYLRVLHNGVVVTKHIPFCKDAMFDKFLGLCPLDNFVKFVRKDNLQGLGATSYAQACANANKV